jgi:hypothetical protein
MNYTAPTYFISLSNVSDYTEIKRFCKKNDIRYMLYTISWKNHILKYGIQYIWTPKTYGDRLYTQVGWMPGWDKECLQRQPETGKFIKLMIDKVETTYNIEFHKNDVDIKIEDYTKYTFSNPTNIYAEMQNFEEKAKQHYFNTYGHYPIGNLKQEKIRPVLQLNNPLWEF